MSMLRRVWFAGGLFVLLLMVAGCDGGPGDETTEETTEETTTPTEEPGAEEPAPFIGPDLVLTFQTSDAGLPSDPLLTEVGFEATDAFGPLIPPSGRQTGPHWNPEGPEIVYASEIGSGYDTELFIVDAETGIVRELTHVIDDGDGESASQPAWSPDGTEIACTIHRLNASFESRNWIAIIDAVTGELLDDLSDAEDFDHGHPTWAPAADGRIAFVRNGELWVRPRDLSEGPALLHSRVESVEDPSWSPLGMQIAFSSEGRIWVLDLETGLETRITSYDGSERAGDYSPCWTGDGAAIVFTRSVDGRSYAELKVVRLDEDPLEARPIAGLKAYLESLGIAEVQDSGVYAGEPAVNPKAVLAE